MPCRSPRCARDGVSAGRQIRAAGAVVVQDREADGGAPVRPRVAAGVRGWRDDAQVDRGDLAVAQTQQHPIDAGCSRRRNSHRRVVDALDERGGLDGGDAVHGLPRHDRVRQDREVQAGPRVREPGEQSAWRPA